MERWATGCIRMESTGMGCMGMKSPEIECTGMERPEKRYTLMKSPEMGCREMEGLGISYPGDGESEDAVHRDGEPGDGLQGMEQRWG